jgi:hypothetical protein
VGLLTVTVPAALTFTSGQDLAYCVVSMVTAAFDAVQSGARLRPAARSVSWVSVNDPCRWRR